MAEELQYCNSQAAGRLGAGAHSLGRVLVQIWQVNCGLQWAQIRFPGIEETSIGIHCRKRHGGLNRKKHRNEKPFRRWIYKNTKSIIYFTGSFAAFSQQQKLDEEIKKMDENHKVLQEPRGDLGMLSRWWLLYDRADLQSFSQHWRDPWRQWIENG